MEWWLLGEKWRAGDEDFPLTSVSSGIQDDESLKNKNKKPAESTEVSTCCWDLQVWDLKTIP